MTISSSDTLAINSDKANKTALVLYSSSMFYAVNSDSKDVKRLL